MVSLLTNFLLGLAFICAAFFVYAAVKVAASLRPTRGTRIDPAENPRQALLVMDIQEDLTGSTAHPRFGYKNTGPFIATVSRVIKAASAQGMVVVYIGHECPDTLMCRVARGGRLIKGGEGTRQDDRLLVASSHYFPKERADAFSNRDLEKFLAARRVGEVFIVGLDAAFCVYKTALGAVNRGFKTAIITDAVITLTKKTPAKLAATYRRRGIAPVDSAAFAGGVPASDSPGSGR